jgi:hypothetical protein
VDVFVYGDLFRQVVTDVVCVRNHLIFANYKKAY